MKKVGISFLCAILFGGQMLAAGEIDTFLNNAVVEIDNPGTMKTKEGVTLYGGGLQMRAPTVNLSPISVSPPRVKAGCGGIDLTFGSLSYLDTDQLVAMLEGMMSNAPGVMFDLALKTICPACSEVLKSLANMANQINSGSLDSCAATKAATNWAAEAISDNITGGSEGSWLKAQQKLDKNDYAYQFSTLIDKGTTWIASLGCTVGTKKCGVSWLSEKSADTSFLEWSMKGSPLSSYFQTSDNVGVMRVFTGDMIKKNPPDGATASGIAEFIPPSGFIITEVMSDDTGMADSGSHSKRIDREKIDENTKALIAAVVGDDSYKTTPKYKDAAGNMVEYTNKGTVVKTFTDKLNLIVESMQTRQPLTTENIAFLGHFRMPVYKIFNELTNVPGGDLILERVTPQFARMLAYEVAYEYFATGSEVIAVQQNRIESGSFEKVPFSCGGYGGKLGCYKFMKENLTTMNYGAKQLTQASFKMAMLSSNDLRDAIHKDGDMIAELREIQAFAIHRGNPAMYESMMFSGTLTRQGL